MTFSGDDDDVEEVKDSSDEEDDDSDVMEVDENSKSSTPSGAATPLSSGAGLSIVTAFLFSSFFQDKIITSVTRKRLQVVKKHAEMNCVSDQTMFLTATPASGSAAAKKPNVVTIDNMETLRNLANDAKRKQLGSFGSAAGSNSSQKAINSILNASHSGVTITPTSSASSNSSINR